MLKAERDPQCNSQGHKDCIQCPEYDVCDCCERRVCKYIAVEMVEDGSLWCIPCCQKITPFSREELLNTGYITDKMLKYGLIEDEEYIR